MANEELLAFRRENAPGHLTPLDVRGKVLRDGVVVLIREALAAGVPWEDVRPALVQAEDLVLFAP